MSGSKISKWLTITANFSILMLAIGVEAQEVRKDSSEQVVAAQIEGVDTGSLDGFGKVYQEVCAVCHGERLEGAPQGSPLIGELKHGDTVEAIMANIASGFPDKGMPPWSATMSETQIKSLAMYVAETRAGLDYSDFNYDTELTVPDGTIETQSHAFRFDILIDDLDAQPFSIAPLPDGSMLLTEKKFGLRVISAEGEKSAYIEGTPQAYDDTYILAVKQEWGYGWLLDIKPHPDYLENGWIYMQFGDRCSDCNATSRASKAPVSLNKIVRGRITDGHWVDEEVIWQGDIEHYGSVPDIAAGGRLTFDGNGHLFFNVGLGNDNNTGIQDLSTPWGKVHRVHENGDVPIDNPFVGTAGALKTIWTYGHRSQQGLEYNVAREQLWATEHGPRGGDEVNLLLKGKNYGWPLYSKGQNYNGTPVAYGKKLGIEYDLEDIQQPVVDLTPSPAVSSFVFYEGEDFPAWQGNLLVGALKARSLQRIVLDGDKMVHRESLFDGVARVRDIEVDAKGQVYVLFEHNSGSQIIRLTPVQEQVAKH